MRGCTESHRIGAYTATRRGIIVMNTPGGNTISTAEHAFSLMVSTARNIPQADASVKSGRWDRKSFVGVELYNKTLAILGMGRTCSEPPLAAQRENTDKAPRPHPGAESRRRRACCLKPARARRGPAGTSRLRARHIGSS